VSEENTVAPVEEAQKTEGPRSTATIQPGIEPEKAEVKAEPSEAVAGNGPQDEEEEEGTSEEASANPKPRKSRSLQDRLDKLTAEKYAKQAEIEARDRRIAELEAQQTRTQARPAESGAAKTLEDFDYDHGRYAEYLREDARQAVIAEQRQKEAQEKRQATEKQFQDRQVAFSVDHPDFVATAFQSPLAGYYPQDMVDFIIESDHGPALAYHLGKNLSEADSILRMTPRERDRALSRIEAKLEAKPTAQPRTLTNAPAPVKSLSGSGGLDKALDQMSMEEFAAKRKQQIAAKRF
jgi:hypothetical protein